MLIGSTGILSFKKELLLKNDLCLLAARLPDLTSMLTFEVVLLSLKRVLCFGEAELLAARSESVCW